MRLYDRPVIKSLFIFLMLMGFFLPSFFLYHRIDREMRAMRANFAAAQVAARLDQIVRSRAEAMNTLRHLIPELKLDDYASYAHWSTRIMSEVPGFAALNFINPDGVIAWVVPESADGLRGKRPIDRDDVRRYMDRSKETHRPEITPIVSLMQGGKGLIIYEAVFEHEAFKGWLAGVFPIDSLIGDLLVTREFAGAYLKIDFIEHPGNFFEYGKEDVHSPAMVGYSDIRLLNQPVRITMHYLPVDQQLRDIDKVRWLIILGVVMSSVIISIFSYLLMRSRERMKVRLEKEHFQSVLLNLLVHDIINPLLVVRFSTDVLSRETGPLVPVIKEQVDKMQYAITQLNDVIGRVKDMRALELGKLRLHAAPVPVNNILDDTLVIFGERMRAKNLTADFRPMPDNPSIQVDRLSFQNNVINNVVSNAIKFSEPGSKITVCAYAYGSNQIIIEVVDHGIGMTEEIRSRLFLENVDVTKPGTMGELGTGIGMLQVHSYTRIFGGHVVVESKPKKAGSADHGTTVRLYLPRAQD